jgi:hypothetical protein
MSDFTELYGVDSHGALMFFFEHLWDEITLRATRVTREETLYVSSILAHYAQTSRSDPEYMSPSGSLYDLLDTFVLPGLTAEGFSGLHDPEILEIAGSHTLLLVGFFRDQINRRHNLDWYDQIGTGFIRASDSFKDRDKANLLRQVGGHFPTLALSCRNMSRTLREKRYLLRL